MNRIKTISLPDYDAKKRANEHWNGVAKPLGSLGELEKIIEKIAAVQGTENVDISKRQAVIMCADNGVVCEGITQSDSEVTAICAEAIANGTSNINCLANVFNTGVTAVDIGINRVMNCPALIDKKVDFGTKNINKTSAMTRRQAEQAVCTGIDIVGELKKSGVKIIVTGEMGIGNTTTSSAVASVILDLPPELVTGRGAGLDSKRLRRKTEVVKNAIRINSPDKSDPIDILSKLGGFDIAGMTGLFLGGAIYKIPVITDGVISAVSANLACKINPLTCEYILASHVSKEPAGHRLLENIGLSPVIDAGMRLGEGTGGIMLLPLLDGALEIYNSAHKFEDIDLERYVELT